MNQRLVHILLVLVSLAAVAYATCPAHCTTCSTPTSCSACDNGFFLVNQTFCPQCPQGCSACRLGLDGRPNCTACASPYQLSAATGQCFLCDPSCLTCAGQPKNCTSCKDGTQLAPGINNSTICGPIPNCSIPNCGACTLDPQNNTICGRCLSGYFPYKFSCIPCAYPCQACNFDQAFLWTNITIPFWNQTIRQVLNITTPIPSPTAVPPFMNGLNFANMSSDMRNGWVQAYLLFKVLQPTFSTQDGLINLIPAQIPWLNTLLNSTASPMDQILLRINQLTTGGWTWDTLNNKTAQVAASIALCAQCSTGFQNSTNISGSCQRCAPHCLECGTGLCTRCEQGFYLLTGVCTACNPSCLTCSSTSTNCTSCAPPASLTSSFTCVRCNDPCATCLPSNASSCITCKLPFALNATTAGGCVRCDQDLCAQCLTTNYSICLQCKNGSTLINGACSQCQPNCLACTPGNQSICFQCNTGFSLITTATGSNCMSCGPGCLSCDSTNASVCLTCQDGTFLNPANATCQRCKVGCDKCTSIEVCTQPSSGVVIVNGNTVRCRPGCNTCDSSSPDVCTECSSRFFLSSGVCKPCGQGCSICTSGTVCTTCLGNLILNNGSCLRCGGGCLTCNSANLTSCTSCIIGFTLVGTNCVQQCQRGCQLCSATNNSVCTTCLPGNALRADGLCVRCLGQCSGSCDPKNISICLSCSDGFQLLNNQCTRCPEGCSSCLNGQCSACVFGFSLNQDATGSFVCLRNCPGPCSACTPTGCTACNSGFTLLNGMCNPDLSCNPNCAVCHDGTQKLANGTCLPCPPSCSSCSNGTCMTCLDGFFLNSTTCLQCPPQCRTCYDNNTCGQCADGFVKQVLSMDSTGIAGATFGDSCLPCSTNCKTCQVDPYQCTSCPEGSRLFGSRCAGMFTVSYQYELNITYSDFIQNSQSEGFVNAISNMTGVNANDTYIQFVREGSTVIGGTLSTSSQTSAQSVQQSLSSSVSGYPVLSSSATVYYGDQPYTAPTTTSGTSVSIGLIVGVVIGGVVLIVIISIIIYKLKCKKTQINEKQQSTIAIMELKSQDPVILSKQ